MKVDNPIKTSSGWSHQTSARIVSPNERRGSAVVPFIRRPLPQLAASPFSTLPNYREHSKAHRNPAVLKGLWRCWRGNRFRNRPPWACCDRALLADCQVPERKCGGRRGHAPSSIHRANAHRQSATKTCVHSTRARSSGRFFPAETPLRATPSFRRSNNPRILCIRFEQITGEFFQGRHHPQAREELAFLDRAASPPKWRELA